MILYYAIGGGAGHIVRARKVLEHFSCESYKVITASDLAFQVFETKNILLIPKNWKDKPSLITSLLDEVIKEHQISTLYIDTFPLGILKELKNWVSPISTIHITRRMKWKIYQDNFPTNTILFTHTYCLEKLEDDHFDFLASVSGNISNLQLDSPKICSTPSSVPPIYLIIHSEPIHELEELLNYAQEIAAIHHQTPLYKIVTACNYSTSNNSIEIINHFPASDFYSAASKIFTAAGFNSMTELKKSSIPHYFLPFERKYDDQHWRAKNHKYIDK